MKMAVLMNFINFFVADVEFKAGRDLFGFGVKW